MVKESVMMVPKVVETALASLTILVVAVNTPAQVFSQVLCVLTRELASTELWATEHAPVSKDIVVTCASSSALDLWLLPATATGGVMKSHSVTASLGSLVLIATTNAHWLLVPTATNPTALVTMVHMATALVLVTTLLQPRTVVNLVLDMTLRIQSIQTYVEDMECVIGVWLALVSALVSLDTTVRIVPRLALPTSPTFAACMVSASMVDLGTEPASAITIQNRVSGLVLYVMSARTDGMAQIAGASALPAATGVFVVKA